MRPASCTAESPPVRRGTSPAKPFRGPEEKLDRTYADPWTGGGTAGRTYAGALEPIKFG